MAMITRITRQSKAQKDIREAMEFLSMVERCADDTASDAAIAASLEKAQAKLAAIIANLKA